MRTSIRDHRFRDVREVLAALQSVHALAQLAACILELCVASRALQPARQRLALPRRVAHRLAL
jgi:hypothetical protein